VRIVTLGCAKNDVDSEEIAGVLKAAGYAVGVDGPPDLTVVNTCGFLEASKQESIHAIRKAVAEKGEGRVVVAGCLSQRLGAELQRLAPGADAYVGVGQMARFDQIVEGLGRAPTIDVSPPHHRWANVGSRARTGRPWSAYLKVSEGCDHRCAFCTIPSFRGGHQSKPLERVLDEARALVSTGAKELNLIAQDVTQYGFDLYKQFTLPKLLSKLNEVEGAEWVRLLYFYPSRLTDEVIDAMAGLDKVLKYIDIPLQHVHPDTLRRMKRPWDGERYLRLFERVRAAMPDVAIRTTFIVGFPGESESEFGALLDFVRDAKLDRVGAFTYSRERGTPAYDMPGQVPFRVKRERFDRLMRLQRSVSAQRNKSFVGQRLDVLFEENTSDGSRGRSYRDAPEIDGTVSVSESASPGSIRPVLITGSSEHDLFGRLL
jgi:ribosomal protein S12 methylthiotransferase